MSETEQTKSKLIVALDVATAKEAREIVAELDGAVGAFKIGLQLFTAAGAKFVRELTEKGAKIFLDLKFHDIPNTVANAGIEAARLNVWMFNVHASGGREMMERTLSAVREIVVRENLKQPKIIAVTVLTSSTAETLRQIGIENEPLPQVLRLSKLAESSGLDGVVASPLEIAAIREVINNKSFSIVTPGIRTESGIAGDDQKRVLSAAEAVRTGADYLVVGRPILQADDKLKAARQILSEIEAAN